MKIQVLVDIYRNYFPQKYSGDCVYDNVRAIDPNEQDIVDECIAEMEKQTSLIILDRKMRLPMNELKPLEENRKAILNVENKNFEF